MNDEKNAVAPSVAHELTAFDDDLLHRLASELQAEWAMGGLAPDLYFEFAATMAKRFYLAKVTGGLLNKKTIHADTSESAGVIKSVCGMEPRRGIVFVWHETFNSRQWADHEIKCARCAQELAKR